MSDINWIGIPPVDPLPVMVQVSYRSEAVPATILPTAGKTADVRFASPQTAVTPGQAAVFYRDQQVLGGGWITGPAEKS